MNAMPEGIIVNSCQYTPVYLIQDPGASQGQSYYIAQSNVEEPKPISDNLKAFYESSGNIENSIINVNSSPKPRIVKRADSCVVGNNLKLASFLLPKNENVHKQQYVANSIVMKSNVTTSNSSNSPSSATTVPRLNIDSKIVKLKNVELKNKFNRVERPVPKTKPKEVTQAILTPAPTKHTSVQLLKLGETYHSLNQLSDDQKKLVTQALKIFSNPEKIAPEPTYDPVTNTKFIYKVVSPRDLTVVGKNKIVTNKSFETKIENIVTNNEIKKESITKDMIKKDLFLMDSVKKDIFLKNDNLVKKEILAKNENKKDIPIRKSEEKVVKHKVQKEVLEEPEVTEPKVTRSGRKVKLPRPILPEDSPHKPKKKNTYITCFQCSAEFNSLYRLQKHYESHPTHIPAKIHSNLFHCLVAIVKAGGAGGGERANMFLQQLQQLVLKLRALLPCLLAPAPGAAPCTVSEDVGRLLGMEPGKYNLDIEALNCVKNKDGVCRHSHPGDAAATPLAPSMPDDDCARINSVEKWPTVNKRVWKQKQQKENAKRMRMASESDTLIELGVDDLAMIADPVECAPSPPPVQQDPLTNHEPDEGFTEPESICLPPDAALGLPPEPVPTTILDVDETLLPPDPGPSLERVLETQTQTNHPQFHSAHFDIRSSPIKPTSTVFRKFQINPQLLAKYEEQVIRSIEAVDKGPEQEPEPPAEETNVTIEPPDPLREALSPKDTLREIFRDEDLSVVKESFTLDREFKEWILCRSEDKSEDGFGKSSTLIEPALLHLNQKPMSEQIETKVDLPTNVNHDESSVLNFLDSLESDCLSYPGTEIRTNNGDFQLDLFSFHSS